MEQQGREYTTDEEFEDTEERGGRGRGRGLLLLVLAIVVIGLIAVGIWWVMTTFRGTSQQDVVGAVHGYFVAGALNDRETADQHIYHGPDAAELGADDFSAAFDPEIFFGYRAVQVRHFFAGENGAYLHGLIEYNQRPPREFTAVLRQREDGNWGLLRLALSEPLTQGTPASMLVGQTR